MRIDGNLYAELNADIQKELNLELNRAKSQKSKDSDQVKVTDKSLECVPYLLTAAVTEHCPDIHKHRDTHDSCLNGRHRFI